ncbi:unnamed protein product [Trichobilharzia szidati]|nr:unnamed protein product [Trichobilharzia szidati]
MELDSLCKQWNTTLDIDEENSEIVSESQNHPRLSLYKNKGRAVDQERRWRQQLAKLRSKKDRSNHFDCNRFTLNNDENLKHPWASNEPPSGCSKIKSWRRHSKFLMLAEWLLFMPPNFTEEYSLKLCPKGRHVFVKASEGETNVYTRNGHHFLSTVSRLPGGGLGQSDRQNSSYMTLLDCILWSAEDNVNIDCESEGSVDKQLYVIDIIYMRSTVYSQLSFRERSVWMETYLKPQIEEFSESDPLRFHIVPSHRCDTESMQNAFSSMPSYEVDGVLFYHDDVTYEPGATPLVNWLKPYMLPEWFPNIKFHPDYMKDMPSDYTDYINEIQQYEAKSSKSLSTTSTQMIT